MAIKRKKTIIDGTDKEILRVIHHTNRDLSGRQIADKVGLSAGGIIPRLNKLKRQGIIKDECKGFRNFDREFNVKGKKNPVKRKVKSCSRRVWKIDYS